MKNFPAYLCFSVKNDIFVSRNRRKNPPPGDLFLPAEDGTFSVSELRTHPVLIPHIPTGIRTIRFNNNQSLPFPWSGYWI